MKSLALLSLCLLLSGPTAVTVAGLLEKPDAYSGKEVKTSGKVEKFEQKTSKAGNPYFVFKLVEKEKKVSVYGQGTLAPPLKNGSLAEVVGTFRMENKVGSYVYKNEIQTSPKGVKALPSKD